MFVCREVEHCGWDGEDQGGAQPRPQGRHALRSEHGRRDTAERGGGGGLEGKARKAIELIPL